jgi:hypothetical protein
MFSGQRLAINDSTTAAGSLRVEIRNAVGKPIRGNSPVDCPEILRDDIERVVI